jgi:hypothetical protein
MSANTSLRPHENGKLLSVLFLLVLDHLLIRTLQSGSVLVPSSQIFSSTPSLTRPIGYCQTRALLIPFFYIFRGADAYILSLDVNQPVTLHTLDR